MKSYDETFIDDDFLRKLEKLKLLTKKGLKGPEQGDHRAKQTGDGLEFLDYRKYHLGDDLRYVDWSVYGRLDKLFIKLFHAEESQTVHILLDMSRSMGCGVPPKFIRAKKIAAAVAYICLSSFDKVGVTAFADKILQQRPPARGRRRFPELLDFIYPMEPGGKTDINACLMNYAALRLPPGIAIVLSDLFDPKGYQDGLRSLVYRNFDIHLVQILDHEEIFWSTSGNLQLTDVESGKRKTVYLDRASVKAYRKTVDRFISGIRQYCAKYGVSHYIHDTQIPFEDFLMEYLTTHSILSTKQ